MFTIDQIKAAHAKVKSGADFPRYIQDIMLLGVSGYETRVENGKTIYFGAGGFSIESGVKYSPLAIADQVNTAQFKIDLRETQQGKTDFPTFCQDAAKSGVQKWMVDMAGMTCTYVDKAGNPILVETIPVPQAKKTMQEENMSR